MLRLLKQWVVWSDKAIGYHGCQGSGVIIIAKQLTGGIVMIIGNATVF